MSNLFRKKSKPTVSDTVDTSDTLDIKIEVASQPTLLPYVPGVKHVYAFDPVSGELVGETLADESPLEPGVFLMPAFSTDVAPPEYQAGLVRVWDRGEWKFKADGRKESRGTMEEDKAAQAIGKRNALLAASDWTQLPDAPVDRHDWTGYRKSLRDVPKQDGFPNSIIWPTPPKL